MMEREEDEGNSESTRRQKKQVCVPTVERSSATNKIMYIASAGTAAPIRVA